jgi:hypothetical protein
MKRVIYDRKALIPSKSDPSVPSVDVDRARAIWDEYCRTHDISSLKGQTAGIEPVSGRIWFGESGLDVHRKKVADGIDAPMYVVRVGYDYYVRKGARR